MTQSQSSQLFSLQLLPMQIPEAAPQVLAKYSTSWLGASDDSNESLRLGLSLYPGEPSEMVVQIKNLHRQFNLQLDLQVKGDFPQQWCRLGMEGSQVPASQQMEAVLYFQIPQDFFEDPFALRPGETLKINYVGHLSVNSTQQNTGRQQIESITFYLYVRPHSLYPRFLPGIYQEVDFVRRFLKIFEQSFEPYVHTLDNLWAYLDPLTAPTGMLPFLAHWVAWNQTPQISLDRQRYLIKSAIEIYRWRGTRRGLRFYLHLATGLPLDEDILNEGDKHIAIYESFSQGFVLGETRLREDSILGGGRTYHFTVHLRPDHNHQIDQFIVMLVRQVIEQEKPAFCTYDLWIESRSTQ